MGIISWLVLGLIAGFIGSKLVNKTGEGLVLDIALGIVGAIVGGWLFTLFTVVWTVFLLMLGHAAMVEAIAALRRLLFD